ncbi:MAG: glycosyltransferase family 2 protein [Acidobacteriia bacterium]|nr:glycosyltransferase family 2 protein [Terriglobia bacterium]
MILSSAPPILPSATGPAPEISVIIVSWNACRFLEECLESLSRGVTRSYEVIVVDNASSDGSANMVTARFPWVTLIQSEENLGFAKGNNLGIRRSRGRYLALINSDVKVLPACLDRLAAFLDDRPHVGMVGPRIMYDDGRQQSSCRRFPGLWNNICELFRLNRLFPRSAFFAGEHMFYFSYDRVCEVDVLVGCFILVRRVAVEHVGLLDESFWMYGEDLDWCRRCWSAGWKVMFYPGAEAIHYCGASSAKDPVRFGVAQQQARLRFWAKHYSWLAQCWFIAINAIQCCCRLFAAGFEALANKPRRQNSAVRVQMQIQCLRAIWECLFVR